MFESWFESGLEPEEIQGAVKQDGVLMIILKFKGQEEPVLIPATEVNQRIPQMVIKFYEERLYMPKSEDEDMKDWRRIPRGLDN
ncbi:heterochromatin protein 1L chromoshadow domain [Drosophila ananassae]|uniref:Heterochromatin protein 1L chromoshadow domain n=1 Tax=Drosophila ananassae TaxID=7217 RepID=B3MBM0_DROAN|nr:heterochromatin protein 1L chromoshadow domain [Drosophila ananassae]